jgi:hypothetical protein
MVWNLLENLPARKPGTRPVSQEDDREFVEARPVRRASLFYSLSSAFQWFVEYR